MNSASNAPAVPSGTGRSATGTAKRPRERLEAGRYDSGRGGRSSGARSSLSARRSVMKDGEGLSNGAKGAIHSSEARRSLKGAAVGRLVLKSSRANPST